MRSIRFENTNPFSPADPMRMDVACFVGRVHLVPARPPSNVCTWLEQRRWTERAKTTDGGGERWDLTDVPVPVESWEQFQELFQKGGRLARHATINSEAFGSLPQAASEALCLTVAVDGRETHVQGVAGETIAALAAKIDEQVAGAQARVLTDTGTGRTRLAIQRTRADKTGHLTVWSNPRMGFPRPLTAGEQSFDTYLAAAVRAFFATGGRRCYVVSMGPPPLYCASIAEKCAVLADLLGWSLQRAGGISQYEDFIDNRTLAVEADLPAEKWRGLAHILGLPDAAYLCLPDLPDLLGLPEEKLPAAKAPPGVEVFTECSAAPQEDDRPLGMAWEPPRCGPTGLDAWVNIVTHIEATLEGCRPDMHLVAALPLPGSDGKASREYPRKLTARLHNLQPDAAAEARARFQLVYPWLHSTLSRDLPGGVEPAEGALLGTLATGSLEKGAFHSIAGRCPVHALDLYPPSRSLSSAELEQSGAYVSVFGPGLGGIELFSDVTPARDFRLHQGGVSRLLALVLRAARTRGDSLVFEPSGERLWRDVTHSLSILMNAIFEQGGLRGVTPAQAFRVVCDRSTMTRADLDSGRLVARIELAPAIPVERLTIALAMDRSGHAVIQGGGL